MEQIKVEQNTPEWLKLRNELLTASDATAIVSMGAGLETLIFEKVVKQLSSAEQEHYDNKDTLRGHELEPIAASIYELDNDVECEIVGLCINSKYPGGGCSPDRFVGEGNLQIKCPDDKNYLKILLSGKPDTGYIHQVQMEMMITEKKWTDLMFYNPNFSKSYVIFRILPNLEEFKKLEEGIKYGINKIKELKQEYESKIG